MTIPIPDPEHAPSIPPKVRTVSYVVTLVTGAVATSTIGLVGALAGAGVIDGTLALVVSAGVGAVASTVATIGGGLGTVYRPRAT